MREAAAAGPGADVMALATATPDGRPSVRMVLCRAADRRGLIWYTGYASRKGEEVAANPRAAAAFYWPAFGRQVRAEGRVERVTAAESDAYFVTRGRGSQLGSGSREPEPRERRRRRWAEPRQDGASGEAWVSPQSRPIADRAALEAGVAAAEARFGGRAVERPPDWGGYRLIPDAIEFWESRPSRLHDRIRWALAGSGSWTAERLAP